MYVYNDFIEVRVAVLSVNDLNPPYRSLGSISASPNQCFPYHSFSFQSNFFMPGERLALTAALHTLPNLFQLKK